MAHPLEIQNQLLDKYVPIRMKPQQREQIRILATKYDTTKAAVVREALKIGLKRFARDAFKPVEPGE